MDERRRYPRETLTAALVCVCETENGSANFLLRNISLDGMLLECPKVLDMDFIHDGDVLTLCEVLLGPKSLFKGVSGKVVWLHKPHIGLHLSELLMESPEALRSWLVEKRLI